MPKCVYPSCESIAIFRSLGDDYPTYCKLHKLDDQYNSKYKKCQVADCLKMATYGNDEYQRCGLHKLPTDSNRCNKNKKCKKEGCTLISSYGNVAFKPLFCASHKLDGMWAVCQPCCKVDSCKISAAYGVYKGKAYHCYLHRIENEKYMLKKPECIQSDCKTMPTFGLPGGDALYCKEHIPQDRNEYVDVKHSKCKQKGCDKRPTFGDTSGVPLYCALHKEEGHFDVANKRCCVEGCEKYPRYGVTKGIAIRCVDHKLQSDILVFAESLKERYEAIKDTPEYKQRQREQYVKHKDKVTLKSRQYYNDNYLKKLVKRASKRSIKKGLDFNISFEHVLSRLDKQNYACVYCRCVIQVTGNIGVRQSNVVSIDRINSKKGYTVDNIHLTCMFCNYAKNNWSEEEYRTFLKCIIQSNNDDFLKELASGYVDWRWKQLSCIKQRDKKCSLTLHWLDTQLHKQNHMCYYSGLHLIPKQGKPYIFQPSIERLDNSKPHTQENCVLVCLPLNYGRCSTSLDLFLRHLENIKKTHK